MISYIVASHDERILNDNLLASLDLGQDQLIIVNEKSIAIAYNRGLRKAKYKIKCFIHHDIFIKNSKKLRQSLITHCKDDVGIVGVIGSKSAEALPWWSYDHCGSAFDARMGEIYFSAGNEECALLDGIMLATAQDIRFDESYPGYHMYDHDMCQQMLSQGLVNFCLANGSSMLFHNTNASSDVRDLYRWEDCIEIYKRKWSTYDFS